MTIHKEGRFPLLITLMTLAVCAFVVYMFLWMPLLLSWIIYGALIIIGALFCFFFRQPNRALTVDKTAAMAPADGKVIMIKEVFEQEYLKENRIQVSIFMSIFNVHINWFPVSGSVEYCKHHNGHFHVASHPKSSEKNEHTTIVLKHHDQKIMYRQIAGFIARRVVCYAKLGKEVLQCSQSGFIKFGSRVDLLLPLDATIHVKVGQKVKGAQTIIAHISQT